MDPVYPPQFQNYVLLLQNDFKNLAAFICLVLHAATKVETIDPIVSLPMISRNHYQISQL